MIQACYLLPELIRDSERERVLKKEGDSAIQREEKKGDLSCQRGEMVRNEGGGGEELLKGKRGDAIKNERG